jgi:hypothetical protein
MRRCEICCSGSRAYPVPVIGPAALAAHESAIHALPSLLTSAPRIRDAAPVLKAAALVLTPYVCKYGILTYGTVHTESIVSYATRRS